MTSASVVNVQKHLDGLITSYRMIYFMAAIHLFMCTYVVCKFCDFAYNVVSIIGL